MDTSESNAGVRLSGSKAAPSPFRRPSRSDSRREYVVESSGQGKAVPILTIMLDRGCLSYGVNSKLVRSLSSEDLKSIEETLRRIFSGKWC